jgi:indolepyruvate ferredoxin oxidoreductase beta subunit
VNATTTIPAPASVWNVTLVGVGGQGTILVSDLLAIAAMEAGHDVKKSEIHGMSQRGGSVVSQVRFGTLVRSPIIPVGATDLLVAFERTEALRYAHLARPDAVVLVNDAERVPVSVSSGAIPPLADADARLRAIPGLRLVPADALAVQAGNPKTANVVLLGALSRFTPIPEDVWQTALTVRVPPRFLDVNRAAFALGRAALP